MLKMVKRHFLTSSILGMAIFSFSKGITPDFEKKFENFLSITFCQKKVGKKFGDVKKC